MSDKELLELAAKANGYKGKYNDNWKSFCIKGTDDGFGREYLWNPLTDDGHAFRLAVKLGLLYPHNHDRFDLFQRLYLEELNINDNKPSIATHRAIVRAAAEIGRTMP